MPHHQPNYSVPYRDGEPNDNRPQDYMRIYVRPLPRDITEGLYTAFEKVRNFIIDDDHVFNSMLNFFRNIKKLV